MGFALGWLCTAIPTKFYFFAVLLPVMASLGLVGCCECRGRLTVDWRLTALVVSICR